MSSRDILHCDINNFFASVEILLHPELVGKPVAVCGDPERRHGIVLAKSNIAKAAGIKTGDAVWQAKQKCPDLVVVAPTYKKYAEYSKLVYDIYVEFTSSVESFGLDECWLDITASKNLFGTPEEIAFKVKETVKERTGLTISVGVSFTKVFAKLGSDLKKPDAITVISRENFKTIAWNLPVEEMLFIGHSTKTQLKKFNIATIGDLAKTDIYFLEKHFGKQGVKIYEYANGLDNDNVKEYNDLRVPDSVGNGTTTPADITNLGDATSVIYALSEMIGFRLRQYDMVANGVSINMRNVGLTSFSRQGKIMPASNSANDIAMRAVGLLNANYNFATMPPLRTITIGTFNLEKSGDVAQDSFFEESSQKSSNLEESIDKLRKKYGYSVLKRGVTIDTIFTCDSREADDDFVPFHSN